MQIVCLIIFGAVVPSGKLKYTVIFMIVTVPILVLMNFTNLFNEYAYVILMGLFTSITSYINNVNAVHIPFAFIKYNDVSRISGISNMCISIGVLAGSFLYGMLADKYGWHFIMKMWVFLGVISVAVLLSAIPRWKEFSRS